MKSGETITAGDIVTYVNGTVEKGVGGQTSDFSVTDPYTMSLNSVSYNSAARLSDSTFVVCYRDGSSADTIAKIGTLSGTSISWGSDYTFSANPYEYASMKALSSSKIVIAYRSQGDGNYIRAIIGEINGNTISFGAEKMMNDDTNHRAEEVSVVTLSSSKFAVLYRDDLDTNDIGKVVIGTVSGTTISNGDQYTFDSSKPWYSTMTSINETTIIVTYVTYGPNTSYCIAGNVSGTNISWGNKYTYTTTYGSDNKTARLSDNKFVLAFQDKGTNKGTAIVGQVTGTVIEFGEQNDFTTSALDQISVSSFDETKFVLAGRTSNVGKAIVGNVSDKTITWSTLTDYYTTTYPYYVACEVINDSQFVITYRKGNDNGVAVVGYFATINSTGIAATGGSAGDTIKVAFSGLIEGLSGLTANSKYYADDNGNLTTTETERYIGTALSTTSLLIQSALPGAQAIEDGDIVASKLSGSSGTGLENGTSGQVLQSNADGTFSWAEMIRLTPQSSAPATCDSSMEGMMALTSDFKLCVCRPNEWRKIDADTTCAWTTE